MEFNRSKRDFLKIIPAALAAIPLACGPSQPDSQPESSYTLVSNPTTHGIHFLLLDRGDANPSTGAYISVLARQAITAIPNYEHRFPSHNFSIHLELGYNRSTNILTVGVNLENPLNLPQRDAFRVDLNLPPESLSFLIASWRGFQFNPTLIFNNKPQPINRTQVI